MNRYIFKLVAISVISILNLSCHSNRLKIDDKTAKENLITAEQVKAKNDSLFALREKQLADSLAKLPKGYRFKEDRSVDPNRLPVKIDIASNLNNVKDIKLSAIASSIKYVRMETPPDPSFLNYGDLKYQLLDDYIVANNLLGILLYSKEGKFIRQIIKNESTGITKKNGYVMMNGDITHVGSGIQIWSLGNDLYYTYRNDRTGQKGIVKYDCSKLDVTSTNTFDPENPNKLTGLGEMVMDISSKSAPNKKSKSDYGAWIMDPVSLFSQFSTFLLDKNTYSKGLSGKNMLGIFNTKGDTLATFTKHEQLKNYTKSTIRNTDTGLQYERGGNLFFRTSFNDTIFQVIPPNRLLPVYTLNLGRYKLNIQQGLDPDFKLTGKIVPLNWVEMDKYIFITFSKDSYDCTRQRKEKELKYYCGLFNKQNSQFYVIKSDPQDYTPSVLDNDIDGGCFVWPDRYNIGSHNEICLPLKGKIIKDRVNSSQFQQSSASLMKKEEFKQLAATLSDDEDVLMIIQ